MITGSDSELSIVDGCAPGSSRAIPPEIFRNAEIGDDISAFNIYYRKAKLGTMTSHRFRLRKHIQWIPIRICAEGAFKIKQTQEFSMEEKDTSFYAETVGNISNLILHNPYYNEHRASLEVLDLHAPDQFDHRFMQKIKIWIYYYNRIKKSNRIRLRGERLAFRHEIQKIGLLGTVSSGSDTNSPSVEGVIKNITKAIRNDDKKTAYEQYNALIFLISNLNIRRNIGGDAERGIILMVNRIRDILVTAFA
ncbi:hypothetical protein [Xenorhabdus sp. IM139775]|uniref:hypothetical protein n=1 Tax=Xenorhabdus sp. IM139775 TaxID=3025876 RepID=UPI00235997EA|nr:hypothetical protein [Xenorhabdus sp. IM139775]MDC9592764.1 hypothetical protein [Xenorhabdus sp. IM139775]